MFNLVVSLYFEEVSQQLVQYWIDTLVVARGCNIFHPCHNPAFHIGTSESPAPLCCASNIDIAFEQVSCFPIRYDYLSHHFLRTFYTLQTHFTCQLSSLYYSFIILGLLLR